MGEFLDLERIRQAELKRTSSYFSERARGDGMFAGKRRPFCLPLACAEENILRELRAGALSYFQEEEIVWHQGRGDKPSNHLCDSQVCCVNFLWPFARRRDALAELLRPVFPTITEMEAMEGGDQYVSFEWIGEENYLGEKVPKHGHRKRGANVTSADAAVMFETKERTRQIVLIEWKYTESYGGTSLAIAKSGTDRTKIYAPLYDRADCPIDKSLLRRFGDLFYEPFYQFMRQQLLASEMERAREKKAHVVSVLHIAPAHNRDFERVTSPALRSIGTSAIDVWKRLLRNPDRFKSVSVEGLFGGFPISRFPELAAWWEYITDRYSWIQSP